MRILLYIECGNGDQKLDVLMVPNYVPGLVDRQHLY